MAKRTLRNLKKGGTKSIRQNRIAFRKEVIGHRSSGHAYQKPIKIKGKNYIVVKK